MSVEVMLLVIKVKEELSYGAWMDMISCHIYIIRLYLMRFFFCNNLWFSWDIGLCTVSPSLKEQKRLTLIQ
jgi:hypothetical protein